MKVLMNLNPTEARVHADTCLFTKGDIRGVAEYTEVIVIAERKAIRWHLLGPHKDCGDAITIYILPFSFIVQSPAGSRRNYTRPSLSTYNERFCWRAERGRHTV